MKTNATNKVKGNLRRILTNVLTIAMLALFLVSPVYAQEGDSVLPSDVKNLQASPGNASVTLSWDVATDNTAVVGYNVWYGTQSVNNEGGEYTEWLDAGNVVEYTVKSLNNGTPYYFAVTAYDAAGNESLNYSNQASTTPVASAGSQVDDESPEVSGAEARYQTVIKVVFTEEVVLPDAVPELAFQITNTKTLETLEVNEAMYASDYLGDLFSTEDTKTIQEKADELPRTIVLLTDPQVVGDEYKVEVSIDIEDLAGNPVASGISDTAIFLGSGEAEPVEETNEDPVVEEASEEPVVDTDSPEVLGAKALTSTEVEVEFSEKIVLSADPTNNFLLVAESDGTKELTIIGVVVEPDGKTVKLTTSNQEAIDYSLVALEVKDIAGNAIAIESSTASFKGKMGENLADTLAPENVSNLMAEVVDKVIVKLSWVASANSANDLAYQMLYISADQGSNYGLPKDLGKDSTSHEINDLKAGNEYWLKITTVDESGNESSGVVAKVTLAETGLPLFGLILASAVLPSAIRKRKKK